ncbi:heme peroxidase [Mycena haematopus]|nr:heme peroxidase [Mycena haematopus]
MRSFSLTLIAFCGAALHGINAYAMSPQMFFTSLGTDAPSGIPNVEDAVNPICIPYYGLRDAIMGGLFQGRCNLSAKSAVRLSFHDAGTFSLASQAAGLPNSGADGSIIVYPGELLRDLNNGLQSIVGLLRPLPDKFNVSAGDVVHIAGILGVLACPGGPTTQAFVGRPPPRNIAPDGFLPNSAHSVDVLTARFADMGFSAREMVALVGAHSIGKQRFIDLKKINATFDTTPDLLDTRFYTETRDRKVSPGTFQLDSDVGFATKPNTAKDFNRFIGNQSLWGVEYAAAHLKLSLLGLDEAGLTDCSEILPLPIDISTLLAPGPVDGGEPGVDPAVDPVKLEAAIQQYRSIWLV